MSIVDWFVNDMESEERILTKDLVSVAVADKEFAGDEMKTIHAIKALTSLTRRMGAM